MNITDIEHRDGTTFPGTSYTDAVLRPAYDEAKTTLLPHLMQLHRAHLVMLRSVDLITESDARQIAAALAAIDCAGLAASAYNGEFEDLFFTIESQLHRSHGEVTGKLHTARSRNDMGMCLYRMVMREELLAVLTAATELYHTLSRMGQEHANTLSLEHTHTQPAQPSILGHRFLAIADMLGRDIVRLQQAYAGLLNSPMGAAALTGTGFGIDREQMAGLLGFTGLVENSYDAVAGTDYIAHCASTVQLTALNTGRSCVDFLTWCTAEFGLYTVAAPYVQISSIMPQKRNPVSIEHSRSLLSAVAGSAATVLTMMHNTPFGDIVDTEDDLQPHMWRATRTLTQVFQLLTGVLGTITVNTELMRERAEASFANATELADTLVREAGCTFSQAHRIVATLVRRCVAAELSDIRQVTAADFCAAAEAAGLPQVQLSESQLRTALSADNFVAVRTTTGGVAPIEVQRMAAHRLNRATELADWVTHAQSELDAAAAQLERRFAGLLS